MSLKNPPLWKRIEDFDLDEPSAVRPLSKKLQHAQNWSFAFTAHAIFEYKRFVYLCCTEPNGASPSKVVDEVWHLHLTYTRNYWDEFCGKILEMPLHHEPSRGGDKELFKHQSWYERTLQAYRESFHEEPPSDFWQPIKYKQKQTLHPKTVYLSTLFNRNQWELIWQVLGGIYASIILFIPYYFEKTHLFALNGHQFLWFYGISFFLIGLPIWAFVLPQFHKTLTANYLLDNPIIIDSYDALFLRNRQEDLVKVAIADALGTHNLVFKNGIFTVTTGTACAIKPNLLVNETYKTTNIYIAVQPLIAVITEKWNSFAREINVKPLHWPLFILILHFCLGLARIMQGLAHEKPIGFLLLLQLVWAFLSSVIYFYLKNGKPLASY
ncbi:MAG: hypothetical protein RI894_2058, partial [Bacteroidota bacterium]